MGNWSTGSADSTTLVAFLGFFKDTLCKRTLHGVNMSTDWFDTKAYELKPKSVLMDTC